MTVVFGKISVKQQYNDHLVLNILCLRLLATLITVCDTPKL